jgi:DNA modification methylase
MDYKRDKNLQLNLTSIVNKDIIPGDELKTYKNRQRVSILFRNIIPEIPSTTYSTFSIYKYPAKFIPQVIAFVLKRYGAPGMKIFDPFAGMGPPAWYQKFMDMIMNYGI